MPKLSIIFAVSVVATLIATVALWSSDTPRPATPQSAPPAPARGSLVNPPARPLSMGTTPSSSGASPAGAEESEEDPRGLLNREIEREATDADWAHVAEAAASASMDDEAAAGVVLVEVTCKTTFCYADMVADDAEALDRWLNVLPQREPWDTQGHIRVDPNDPLSVEVWFARPGQRLPHRRG